MNPVRDDGKCSGSLTVGIGRHPGSDRIKKSISMYVYCPVCSECFRAIAISPKGTSIVPEHYPTRLVKEMMRTAARKMKRKNPT